VIEKGEESDADKLKFTWKVISQTARSLTIQITFENALYVSANLKPETLKIIFRDPLFFTSVYGLGIAKPPKDNHRRLQSEGNFPVLRRTVPPQLSESDRTLQIVFWVFAKII